MVELCVVFLRVGVRVGIDDAGVVVAVRVSVVAVGVVDGGICIGVGVRAVVGVVVDGGVVAIGCVVVYGVAVVLLSSLLFGCVDGVDIDFAIVAGRVFVVGVNVVGVDVVVVVLFVLV